MQRQCQCSGAGPGRSGSVHAGQIPVLPQACVLTANLLCSVLKTEPGAELVLGFVPFMCLELAVV